MDKDALRECLLDPEPGSAIARARDYGIDLTLNLVNLRLTPAQRLEKGELARQSIELLRTARRKRTG